MATNRKNRVPTDALIVIGFLSVLAAIILLQMFGGT
jgi:hypothetical protein